MTEIPHILMTLTVGAGIVSLALSMVVVLGALWWVVLGLLEVLAARSRRYRLAMQYLRSLDLVRRAALKRTIEDEADTHG